MVIIRLSRSGAKRRPFYNIVATDSRSRRDGRFIERLGFYNPLAKNEDPMRFRVQSDRVAYWKQNGAQVSPTVARLLKQPSAAVAKTSDSIQSETTVS